MRRGGLGKRALSIAALIGGASLAMYAGACGSAETQEGQDAGPSIDIDIEGVLYEGGANDEALVLLLQRQAAADTAHGTVFDAPAAGAALPSDAPPKLAWHVGAAKGAAIVPARGRPWRASGAWEVVREVLGPERAAAAHGPPVNGRAYFLEIKTAKGAAVARVFTTLLEYTPDAAVWGAMKAAGEPMTASIVSGIFDNNRITEDGGPFTGEAVSFSVMK